MFNLGLIFKKIPKKTPTIKKPVYYMYLYYHVVTFMIVFFLQKQNH